MGAWQRRVLIIDDDDDIRGVIADVLADEGYYVVGLDNGEGALDSVRAQKPDLIILDIIMPNVDGVNVAAQLAAMGDETPIIITTGLPITLPHLQNFPRLEKPFERDDLVAMVERAIGPPDRSVPKDNTYGR